jgi:predicted Holliday junction resolvase-like endonuclease
MIVPVWAVVLFVLATLITIIWGWARKPDVNINPNWPDTPAPLPPQITTINMKPLEDALKQLPNKVLQSIQSSTNTKKGALGELIGYIELEAQYDRIIPLGNIVDFMCIKFPEDARSGMNPDGIIEMGRVDFVDIKTGKSSRLSKDQRELQKLIKDKRVNFVKVTVNTQTSEAKPQTS